MDASITMNLVEATNPSSPCCWPMAERPAKCLCSNLAIRHFEAPISPLNELASRQPEPWTRCRTTPLGLRHFQHAVC